jgi:uncharacterized protein (TIGR03032 family)
MRGGAHASPRGRGRCMLIGMENEAKSAPEAPKIEVSTSRAFTAWLAGHRASLVLTTYQTGKIFFIGLQPDGRLSVFERTLERVMGMHAASDEIHVSTLYQIWRFRNALDRGATFNGYDAVYVPRESRVTGDLDVHDIIVDADDRLVFSNTLFNCIATTDDDYNFRPLWRPPWISKLAPEDRCHLNGLAMRDGRPRYATAISRSDVHDGWRDRRRDGGVVIDIETNDVVCEGLSMPHSPRWHGGSLWVINSGTGYFGRVDLERGVFEPLVFLPGYARGMTFIGDDAIIGLSDRRENRTFQDLDLEENLAKHDAVARCGLHVVNLKTFDAPHWLRFGGIVKELYDVGVLPGVIRPMAVGFKTDEVRRYVSFPEIAETT